MTATILAVGPGGVGVAYLESVALGLEVEKVLPGEKVQAEILWLRPLRGPYRRTWQAWQQRVPALAAVATPGWFGRAQAVGVLEPVQARQSPACPHFGACGGCSWQHARYEVQLERKRQTVIAALGRVVGKASPPAPGQTASGATQTPLVDLNQLVEPVIPSPRQWGYRNKLEFTFDAQANLGFHTPGRYWEILPAPQCRIGSEEMVAAARLVSGWAKEKGLPGYDQRNSTGFLRHLVVRQAQATGELMVALETFPPPPPTPQPPAQSPEPAGELLPQSPESASGPSSAPPQLASLPELPDSPAAFPYAGELVARLKAALPHLTSVLWLCNPSPSDVVKVENGRLLVLYGRPYIEEKLAGLTFRIELPTFFQTNTAQAETLVRLAREAAAPNPSDLLFDLYCGVGTFSLPLASACRQVVGIEIVAAAVAAAQANAERNGVGNAAFLAGDTRRVWDQAVATFGGPDVVLLDPPRSGAGGKVIRRIGRTSPRRVVYVSCNPQTLADDLAELLPFGYRLARVQPVDLFPHTDHVETVAMLERTGQGGKE
ncbi:MAG: 23S rRNA (uracil(1939)-C(5))-methyltransferase RlmD [Limnochordaceae bacterium]|nr:23S rRNA (uracil(1939)-C(5))-methyltransferase RlmD [Limnochordaceae bacterium]